jgi:hypothetical protein
MKQKFLITTALVVALSSFQHHEADKEIYTKKVEAAKGQTLDNFTISVAKGFLNRPYKAGTLEVNNPDEKLVVNLREFDCATYVESCVAMSLTLRKEELNFDTFKHYLQRLRYYDGKIKGYPSRIHYFSDWLYQHTHDGLLEDMTPLFGGILNPRSIHFMSSNIGKYPVQKDMNVWNDIARREADLTNHVMYYIPKNKIRSIENNLKNGDIVALTTNIDGLDVTHEGFAIRLQDGRVYLLHASSDFGRVMVTDRPLAEYMATKKNQIGIMVARFK